ncbi:MAG: LacI family DNA-binding transcriptional regulator [Verrucomicrobiota bacterium]|nr:LacI family DNA-binding transcriptional regulator [Verrucomicrobiota bacterium]
MPQNYRRPTLKDVALRAELSVAAVSMALRDHASIPESTCERVRKIAAELGYAPDPALSALAAHRNNLRVRSDFSVIGLISNWKERDGWTRLKSAQEVIEGAKARALQLGYTLQHLWAGEDGLSPKRFSQILKARGIRSIILAPFEEYENSFELDWDAFSVVTIEKPARYPHFHHIMQNQYSDYLLCWEKLRSRGYTRVGLVVRSDLADRASHQWEAAHSYAQSQTESRLDPIPILNLGKSQKADTIRTWLHRYRPQAVISRCDYFFEAAEAEGIEVPEDVAYVSLNISDDRSGVSGIYQHRKTMGATAIDVLNSLLQRNQRGPNEVSIGTQIDGSWRKGDTLPSIQRPNTENTQNEAARD